MNKTTFMTLAWKNLQAILTPIVSSALVLLVAALAVAAPSARGQIIYSNDFSATGLANASSAFSLDMVNGALTYSVSGVSTAFVSTASQPIDINALHSGFVLSSRFTVNTLSGGTAGSTIGFAFLGPVSDFDTTGASTNYQADWTLYGTGTGVGRLRLSVQGVDADFTSVNGSSGTQNATVGSTYELRVIGTYDAGTLNLTLALYDAAGAQIGSVATATDPTPLTGQFFGYRQRTANVNHKINVSFDDFVLTGPRAEHPLNITSFSDYTIDMNTTTGPIPFTVSGGVLAPGDLVVSASSSNPSLLPPSSFVFSGTGSNRFLAVTPALNQAAVSTVSVSVSDGISTVTKDFELAVIKRGSYRLSRLWSTAPNDQPYFIRTGGDAGAPNQRTLAYNSLSNHLYVVARENSASANYVIAVVNADSGAPLYNLNTNGMELTGQVPLVCIEVADDGSIYAGNVDSDGTRAPVWKLYRWANANSNTLPQLVFQGNPLDPWYANAYRWGDAMDLRGTDANTQIIIDNREASSLPWVAILTPTDAACTNFTSKPFLLANTEGGTFVGRSLQFGAGNTFWQKRPGTPLVHSSFDFSVDPPTAIPVMETFANFPATLGPITLDASRHLLGAVESAVGTSDKVDLFDIADPANPVLLSRNNFTINHTANTWALGQIIIAGNRLFALDSQNGLIAYVIESGAVTPPQLQITPFTTGVVLSWSAPGYRLESAAAVGPTGWTVMPFTAGFPNTATDSVTNSAKFYRLRSVN